MKSLRKIRIKQEEKVKVSYIFSIIVFYIDQIFNLNKLFFWKEVLNIGCCSNYEKSIDSKMHISVNISGLSNAISNPPSIEDCIRDYFKKETTKNDVMCKDCKRY
jgi:hypothetical protein